MKKSTTTKPKSDPRPKVKPKAASGHSASTSPQSRPDRDCPLCPRLVAFREDNRAAHPDWFNAPVPQFGPIAAPLLIVGLAPGLQGANRTGRPFTGDYAGDLLYQTLLDYGFAAGTYQERADDGLKLTGCRISNAVHCVPPQNKPTTAEIHTCRRFLIGTIKEMPRLRAIVTLGRISHDSTLKALGLALRTVPFKHGGEFQHDAIRLFSSYHCSRYNTNTGVLTPKMFQAVFSSVRAYLDR
jgi:uracil-DNA glycosylase family 4